MTTIKNRLGLAFAALMAVGMEGCSQEEVATPSVPTPPPASVQTIGKIIGYSSHEAVCDNNSLWVVKLEGDIFGYLVPFDNIAVCAGFRDYTVPNWRAVDDALYKMTLAPRLGHNGKVLTTTDYQSKDVPVFNLTKIVALGLHERLYTEGEITLSGQFGGEYCASGERLYGLRRNILAVGPVTGHGNVLFCDTRNLPFNQRVAVVLDATTKKDKVGRPVYHVLEARVLGEL